MKVQPLVSVIIPTYKRSEMLIRALNSVVSQTYENIEIIIVDDNDGENEFRKATRTKVSSHFKNEKIIYIENKKNLGLAEARNTGVKESSGQFIAFLDDDDVWHPKKIKLQINRFNQVDESYGIVACYWNIINTHNNTTIKRQLVHRGDLCGMFGVNHFAPPSMILIKRHFFEKVGGFDKKFLNREDVELYHRLSLICKFDFVEDYLVDYYIHGMQLSGNIPQKIKYAKLFIEKHRKTLSRFGRGQTEEFLGDLYAQQKDRKRALASFKTALSYMPKRLPHLMAKTILVMIGIKRKKSL